MGSRKKDFNFIIHNCKEPLIFRQSLEWDTFCWDISKWKDILNDESLQFRCGLNAKTITPQWESSTRMVHGNFEDLLELSNPRKWLYFDYKYLNEHFLNANELRENINFEDLGLTGVSASDSTIWIGSKGAHTPCHIDTYGCNVVVQIYGKKRWLLFPFEEDLKPTRIPYEESSIYSKLNFFSPNEISDFKDISNCKAVILNPGDVLIVPHKWWHYVENLELAITINTWLPLPQDSVERQKECLIQTIMGCFTQHLSKNKQDMILNPNSKEDVLQSNLTTGVELQNKLSQVSPILNAVTDEDHVLKIDQLINKYKIDKIESYSSNELKAFLENQATRFSNDLIDHKEEENINVEKFIHAITHPDVIQLMMKKLIE
ncbi:hypothetical protein WA026_002884 [Henosepilachna vigintioctopunctata]|uniref:JmjC domain-containing protein n=1 Tax=Henosepilachna vigintioctopunctata TaxID=420089 RepID=A0AAW1TPR2_9CUCU